MATCAASSSARMIVSSSSHVQRRSRTLPYPPASSTTTTTPVMMKTSRHGPSSVLSNNNNSKKCLATIRSMSSAAAAANITRSIIIPATLHKTTATTTPYSTAVSASTSLSLATSGGADASPVVATALLNRTSSTSSHHHNPSDGGSSSNMAVAVLSAALAAFLASTTTMMTTTTTTSCDAATTAGTTTTTAGGVVGGTASVAYPTLEKKSTTDVNPKEKAEADVRRWEEDASRRPFLVSEGAVQGARWTMEDAYVVANGGHFVAVFDGHGGSQVSSRLRDRLYKLYAKALPQRHLEDQQRRNSRRSRSKRNDDVPVVPSIRSHTAAMRSALKKIERDVLRDDDLEFQGSTCVSVLVHTAEDGRRTLLSANIGDSRAVLSRGGKAVDLTRDHKPNDEKERARIRSMGEDVQWDPWGQIYRIRDLSLSRAIGDRFAKPVVTSEAEMLQEPIRDDEDEFFLLASDGLYDVMTSQEVVDFVRECLKNEPEFEEMYGKLKYAPEVRKENMAKIVANEALERGSADNVCVIVVWLKDLEL